MKMNVIDKLGECILDNKVVILTGIAIVLFFIVLVLVTPDAGMMEQPPLTEEQVKSLESWIDTMEILGM